MTKKHFIELADVLRNTKPEQTTADGTTEELYQGITGGYRLEQWETMRDALADFCESQNPRFNRQRWIAYINGECGPNGGKK